MKEGKRILEKGGEGSLYQQGKAMFFGRHPTGPLIRSPTEGPWLHKEEGLSNWSDLKKGKKFHL